MNQVHASVIVGPTLSDVSYTPIRILQDTEDASETEVCKREEEFHEKKEQLFLEKVASLRKQLQEVADGSHPEYQRRLRKIELIHQERNLFNEVWRQCEMERVKSDCEAERELAQAELEEKTLELQDGLVTEYEEKRRHVELERNVVELTGDSLEVKTASTRKLRRRPNDPIQPLTQEKRRKVSPSQLNLLLDEGEILEDLKLIQRCKPPHGRRGEYDVNIQYVSSSPPAVTSQDAKIEHNKLFYDKKWHHRGQCVCVESREHGRFSGTIENIGTAEISVKKISDGSKVRVTLVMLQRGKVVLRRKS
ncbi:sin3 histone deacetylase corepressor complex component SDS3 [Galendromus occidentalis]|uniref:Sin3 histone deacetylase corepressor complex component SDS3 n=1 Tax=Galendromus occidentalis TaxID=34638 RepID=A0AAJ6QV13_9ACAR|nr:sin3 histone deacetylase corepressor complex component SDS3 [Galendromus occidentalis]